MPKLLREYPENVLMGNVDGEPIYLRRPSWDCGWYWRFGYLGNYHCHYHLDSLHMTDERLHRMTMFEQLRKHFDKSGKVGEMSDRSLWTFCEVVMTVYNLKTTAEVFDRGGSHYTTNPCGELIKDTNLVSRINEVLIPKLIDEMYVVLGVVEPMLEEEKTDELVD